MSPSRHHPHHTPTILLYTAATALLLAATLLAAAPQPAAAYEQAVQPQQAMPGSLFAFFATGFDKNEWVYFWVNDPTTGVHEGGAVRANTYGRADWTWKSPSSALYGRWSMVGHGSKSGTERVIFFEIGDFVPDPTHLVPAGQEEYEVSVTPRIGAPGTAFDFYARGYHGIEQVTFWGYDPTGRMHYLGDFGSNDNGRVDWSWKSPPSAALGTWRIVMHGETSQVERVVYLEMRQEEPYPEEAEPRDTYDKAVSPEEGTTETRFTFFADNFKVGERVDYWLSDPYGQTHKHRRVVANQFGRIDFEWEPHDNAPTGTWTWHIEGEWGSKRSLTFVITEEAKDTPPAELEEQYEHATHPTEGKPGTEFAFFATGFESKEPVDYLCLDPTRQVVHDASTRANKWGRADWTCETAPGAPTGQWTTIATGRDSHIEWELHFTVLTKTPMAHAKSYGNQEKQS
jgi:hypothetical protein